MCIRDRYSYKCLSSIQSKDIFHDNDLEILFSLVAEYVGYPVVLDKVCQYLRRFVSDGGIYVDIERGISLGCPLSPLMGALSRFIVATRVGQHTDQFEEDQRAKNCLALQPNSVEYMFH